MSLPQPVVVTGPGGRLGRALMSSMEEQGIGAIPAGRPEFDLDDPAAALSLIERHRPRLVIHAAAWTDVDGCARQPALAIRRNATAVAELAEACVAHGADLVLVSTNEVFDGERTDRRGYAEDDSPRPPNAYGASKLAGEQAARATYDGHAAAGGLWIVRTAWLFGPPGNDFPAKILAAAGRLGPGEELRVVSDEVGSPTYTGDIAPALLRLVGAAPPGLYHLVGAGIASRFEVATEVLGKCRPSVRVTPISRTEFQRMSLAPAWAVLDASRASSFGITLQSWRGALAGYLAWLCPTEGTA